MANVEDRQLAVVLFEGFELLDVFGPLEVFGVAPGRFAIRLVGPGPGGVRSSAGPAVVADAAYPDAGTPDIVLVPGGIGTRGLVSDEPFLEWLAGWASSARLVTSVCTGSAVLAAAGLLDGYRATSNKLAFDWATGQGAGVEWVRQARWVEDRDRWTSSGVAAGIDMALAITASLHGTEVAMNISRAIEHDWNQESTMDPFA